VAFVCLFALTHTATAWVIVGGWGINLPNVRSFIYVGNLQQDPLFTSSVHGVWILNNEDFSVDFNYEFKHQILDSTEAELNPNRESTYIPPVPITKPPGEDWWTDDAHCRGMRIDNILEADTEYILRTYTRLEVWNRANHQQRDNWHTGNVDMPFRTPPEE
jgi:hypothetical protein